MDAVDGLRILQMISVLVRSKKKRSHWSACRHFGNRVLINPGVKSTQFFIMGQSTLLIVPTSERKIKPHNHSGTQADQIIIITAIKSSLKPKKFKISTISGEGAAITTTFTSTNVSFIVQLFSKMVH